MCSDQQGISWGCGQLACARGTTSRKGEGRDAKESKNSGGEKGGTLNYGKRRGEKGRAREGVSRYRVKERY